MSGLVFTRARVPVWVIPEKLLITPVPTLIITPDQDPVQDPVRKSIFEPEPVIRIDPVLTVLNVTLFVSVDPDPIWVDHVCETSHPVCESVPDALDTVVLSSTTVSILQLPYGFIAKLIPTHLTELV